MQAQVGGKVAQLGQRLIDGAAKSIAEDFFKRFDLEMQRRFAAPEAALPTDALDTAASGAGDGAAGRPKAGVSVPTWAWVAVAAAVAAGVAVLR